jgi:MSHA biogenesis protein MshQ
MNKSVVNLLIILVALFFSSVAQATLITNLTQAELDSGDYSNAEDQLTNNLLGVLPTVQPILEHRFDETGYSDTPNEIIDTVGGFHGQAKGSQPVEGKICNAIDLSAIGTSDYAVLDKDILAGKTDFTISVWAKTTKTTNQSILSGAGNSNNELIMWFTSHITFNPHLKNKKNGNIPTSSIAGNIWRHLVWTREGTQNCLFIDGVSQGCLSLAYLPLKLDIQSLILGQEQDSIGGGFARSQAFDGLLDEFLVFDSAITSAHIATIYDNQNVGNNYDGSSRVCDDTCDSSLGQLNAVGIKIDGGGSNSQINTTTEALTIYAGWLAAGSPVSGLIMGSTYNVAASGTSTVGRIDFGGSSHDFLGTLPYPGVAAGVGGSDFLVHTSGTLSLRAGTYTINVESDDGFSFIMETLSGDEVVFNKFGSSTSGASNELRFENLIDNSNTGGSFTLSEDSIFDLATIFFEHGRDDYLEVAIANGTPTDGASLDYEILAHGALNGKVLFGVCVGPIIDHYQIEHNGNGLTCSAETITIKACTNSACSPLSSEEVSLDFQSDGITKETLTFTGSKTVSLSQTTADTLTLGLINETVPPANATVCIGGSSNLCDLVFADTGFRFYQGGETNPIPTQVSAKPSNILNIQAIKKNSDTGACQAVFIDTTAIEMAATCVDPTACAGSQVAINNLTRTDNINTLNNNTVLSYSPVDVDFSNNTVNSAKFILTYPDAGKIKLHARYNIPDQNGDPSGNYMFGTSNQFVVRPFGFFIDVVNNPKAKTAIEAKFIAAGTEFTTRVKAVQWQAVDDDLPGEANDGVPDSDANLADNTATVNFGNEMTAETAIITDSLYLPNPGVAGDLTNKIFTDFNSGVATNGVVNNKSMTYDEVGIVNFTANLTSGAYLGASDVIGIEPYVGRFIPHHFKLTGFDGELKSTCDVTTPKPEMTFAYVGQMSSLTSGKGALQYLFKPEVTITPESKSNKHTQNYTGDFNKLLLSGINRLKVDDGTGSLVLAPVEDVVQKGADVTKKMKITADFTDGDLTESGGILSFEYSAEDNFFYAHEKNSEIAPFTADINLSLASVIDEDDVTADDADGNGDTGIATDTVITLSPEGTKIRFGRAQLENSYGPETSKLPQLLSVNYFKDGQYIVADDDKCTPYNATKMSLTNIDLINFSLVPALPAITPASNQFIDGTPPGVIRAIVLTAPRAGNTGQVCVSYDIFPWLQYKWATDRGNLQCPFIATDVDGLFNDNPFSIATFGIFRGNDRIIYKREIEKIN